MNRVPWVLALLLAGGTAATIAVMAADQPAVPQPQMVSFVCQFIAFTPKDPTLTGFPRWMLTEAAVRAAGGYWFKRDLGDLVPQFGPLDALKGRDPKAIEELLTRLDDRWNYYVETLTGSGLLGRMLPSIGAVHVTPRTAGGTGNGPVGGELIPVGCVVRVERVGGGRAVMQTVSFTTSVRAGIGMQDCTSERTLGVPWVERGESSGVHSYTSAAGVDYPDAVSPGLICLMTVDLVQRATPQGPAHN